MGSDEHRRSLGKSPMTSSHNAWLSKGPSWTLEHHLHALHSRPTLHRLTEPDCGWASQSTANGLAQQRLNNDDGDGDDSSFRCIATASHCHPEMQVFFGLTGGLTPAKIGESGSSYPPARR